MLRALALPLLVLALTLTGCLGGEETPPGKLSWLPDPPARPKEKIRDFDLALKHLNGDGVPRDPARAYELLRGEAERGHADSAFLIGRLRQEGLGVPRDEHLARDWYERAARSGHIEAQLITGSAYYRGEGRPLNPRKAVKWFRRAAERGNAEAQYRLALALHLGRGAPRNEIEAVRWLEAAAEQNHPDALYLAGDANSDGWHGTRDPAWAARWYGRAAGLGMARAQYKLALFHYGGLGMPRDMVRAYHWVRLASRAGAKGAAGLAARIEERMSEAERAEARALARDWKAWPVPEQTGDDIAIDDPPSVFFAQLALEALSFSPGALDGELGPGTRRALVAYRRARGLEVVETLTPALLRRLKDERPIRSR